MAVDPDVSVIGAGFGVAADAGAGLATDGCAASGAFVSSSAMMRRIDARISSIEGSWTFAGWVMSGSTSSRPLLTPPRNVGAQAVVRMGSTGSINRRRLTSQSRRHRETGYARIALLTITKGMSPPQTIASNGPQTAPFHAIHGVRRGDQRPSGVRTPIQLSRT
jgi:hypothetical protein